MEDSDQHIVILGDYNLLSSCEQVASALAPLCAALESEVLRTMSDVELSRGVAGMALRTLIMETERERRERKRTAIFRKKSSKYQKYHTKHRAMADIYTQHPDFQLFHEGLKQREDQLARKVEDLRERDEDLMKVVARNSELEASLKTKKDELELSRGVMAENADLQAKVASLTIKLGTKSAEIDELKVELNVSVDRLAAVISEATVLEDALRVYRSERTKEEKASALKVARLEGCVKELEAELSVLIGQVALLRTKDAS
ncbi:protein CROWDED NUCLEI 2-like [Nicotiana sylvestris]|uniref:protein CROWDED NUCLEI 2-like n=1 Tax=Nicotiana sylvestris TaxID=4096 RepID=UPI00388CDD4F